MADKTMYISEMLKPSPKMLGSGMAERAAQAMKDRDYQLHVQEMKAQQKEPLDYDEWKKQQNS
jgi:hypothetical protein